MLHCITVIQQMYEKEFAVNILSLKRVPSNLQLNCWTCDCSVTHYYLSVSVQTFKSGVFSHIIIFVLPCFSFKHSIILMHDAQKSFLEYYSGKSRYYSSKEDEYCVLKKKFIS